MGNNAPGFQWSGCLLETSDMLCGITAPFRTHGHYKDAPFMGLGYEGLPLSCCAVLCRPLAWPDGGIQRALWLGWPRMSICTWQGGGTEVSFIWHVRYLSRWAWTKRTLQRVSDWPPRLAPPRPATPLLRPSCPGGACRPGRPEGVLGLSRLASAWWCEGRGRGRGPGRPSAPVHPPISRHAEGSRRAVLQYKSAHPLLSTDPHVPTPQQQQEQHTHSPSHTPIHALAGSHTSTAVSKRAIPQPHIGLERRLTSNLLEIQALAQPARPLQPLPSPAFTWLHPPSRTFWLECCTFLRLHPTPRLAYSLRYIHRRYSMYLCIHPHPSSVPSGKVAVMENINDTIHPSQPQAQPFGMVDFGPDAHRQPSQVQYQVGQVPIAQNGHEGHAPWTQGTNPLDYTFWGSCGLPVSTNEAFGYATASFQEAILDSNDYSFPDRYDAVFTSPRPHDIYHDSGASINPQVVSRLHNPANVSHHGLVQPSRQMSFMSEKSSSLPFVDSFEEYAPSSIAGESAYSPGCSPGDESVATYNSSPSESPQPRTPSPLLPSPVSPVSLPTDARGIFDYGAMPDADSIDHYFGAGSDTSETSSTRGKRKRGTRDIGKTAEEIDVEDDELPYAQLIYKALMSVPSRKMVLSEIYEYFRMNIPRFAKPRQKGWQNSIRHNLSMNGAFLKEERPRLPGDQTKPRGFIWVLSPEAEKEGVKSTTRFRKANNQRKKNAQCASTPKHASQKKRNRRNTKKDVSTSEETVHSPPQGQISTSSETPIQLKPEKGLEQIILTGEDTTNEDMHPQSDSMANLDSQLSLQEIKFFSEIENVYQMSGFEDCYSNIGDDMPDTYDERPAVDLLLGEGISAFNEQFSLVVDRYAQH